VKTLLEKLNDHDRFVPFSNGEIRRLEMNDLSERRAALEAELEELIQERVSLMDDWISDVYSYDEAKERDEMLAIRISDIQFALSE